MSDGKRIALLIDADNVPVSNIDKILTEVDKHGSATVRHAYGNWKGSNLKGWKAVLDVHSIERVGERTSAPGKNATDIAMVIGAMDLLHSTEPIDAYALVSSDADFTPLVERLMEAGAEVFGIGENKAPKSFREACTSFVTLPAPEKRSKVKPWVKPSPSPSNLVTPAVDKQKLCADPAFRLALRSAVTATKAKSGWANLGQVRNEISNQPFELRGSGKFYKLMTATGLFEIRWFGFVVQVRAKPQT